MCGSEHMQTYGSDLEPAARAPQREPWSRSLMVWVQIPALQPLSFVNFDSVLVEVRTPASLATEFQSACGGTWGHE